MGLREYCRLIDRRYQNWDWDPLSARGSNPFYPAIWRATILIWPNYYSFDRLESRVGKPTDRRISQPS